MNRNQCTSCPVCKTKLQARSFDAPECPKCQTVFPNFFRQIFTHLRNGSRLDLRFIRHVHLDENTIPAVIFQKLCESNNVEDLTFRRGREQSDSALSEETCKYIGQLLQHQTVLWHFAVDCFVEEAGWQYIAQGIRASRSLKEVDLSFGSIYAAEQLGQALGASKNITKLTISGKYSTSDVVLKLLEELKHNASLTEVKIENIVWNKCAVLEGLQYIPPGARVKLLNVKFINITDAELAGLKNCRCIEFETNDSLDDNSIGPVMEGLAHNRHIKKVLLGTQNGLMNNAAAAHIGSMFRQNEAIKEFAIASKLSYSYYPPRSVITTGFLEISKGLLSNKALTKLDLSNCSIGDDLDALGEALAHNKTLQSINLSRNYFGDKDLTKFCEALKINTTLLTLNLGWCRISREGMRNFAKALAVNRSLTDIDLAHHDVTFTEEMYPALFDVVKANTALKKVALGADYNFHHIHHETFSLRSVADLIAHNTNITALDLTTELCRFPSQQTVAEFVAALKVNSTLTSVKTGTFWDNRISDEQLNQIFSSNYSLLEADFTHASQIRKYLARNEERRKVIIANTIVLCENIFRSQEAMDLLPPELWMNVFAHLNYPGIGSMAPLIQRFVHYRNSKNEQ